MTIRTPEARQLCTQPELTLYLNSLASAVKKLSPAQLRKNAERAQKLRDKYRQLADRQQREARGKQEPKGRTPSKGNERTRRKEMLFMETLERYEQGLADVEAKEAAAATPAPTEAAPTDQPAPTPLPRRAATKPPAKPARPARSTAAAKGQTNVKKIKVESAAKQSRLTEAGKLRKQKHSSARGRRNQARKDAR
ncbi:MAG: hypothetical protein ACK4RK_11255 [Gemmataceae bacterium]